MDIKEIDKVSLKLTREYLEQRIINNDIISEAIIFFNQYYKLNENPFTIADVEKLSNFDFSLKLDFLYWKAQNPQTEEEIRKFYRDTPFEFFKNLYKNMDIMHFEKILKDMLLPFLVNNKCTTILDYGGGSGYLTLLLHQLGYKMAFSEINKISLEWMRYITEKQKMGIEIIDLYEKKIENNYDVIIVKDILEHLTKPADLLNELKNKAGKLFIIPTELTKEEDYLPMHFPFQIKNG